MRKFRSILLLLGSLLPLLASAQRIQTVVIAPDTNASGVLYQGVPYTVTTTRNLTDYPLTDDGFNRFAKALKKGNFNLRTASGCLIPAGTVPPLYAPTCQPGTGGTVGSGGTTTVITYKPMNLIVIAANSIGYYPTNVGFKWYGDWGAAASAANKDFYHILKDSVRTIYPNCVVDLWGKEFGISIAEGSYFEQKYDDLSEGLSRYNALAARKMDAFIVRLGENITEIRPSFYDSWMAMINKVTSQKTDALKFITTSVWGNQTHDNALIKLATDNNIPLIDLRGIPKSTTGLLNHPEDEAHLAYANKIWKQFKASVTITTTTGPVTSTTAVATGNLDSQGFLVYQDQGWSGPDEKVIKGQGMEMRFKRSVGACPTWLSLDSDGINVVGDQQVRPNGVLISDKGVQYQLSWYSTPAGGQLYTTDGRTIGGTGANPVQGGNTAPYYVASPVEKSAIINDPVRGQVFCSRTRSLLWDWPNTPGHGTVDLEYWFKPNKTVAYKARVNVEERPAGTPEQRKFTALSQEFLCLYNIADFNTHIVDINGSEYNTRTGVPIDAQSNDYFTSKCYIGTYTPDRKRGVLYYTPRNAIFKSWQKVAEQGKWPDAAQAYVNASSKWNMDIVGHYVDNGYIILGSQSEAMAAMAQLEPVDQSFDFDFTNTNNTWWNEDARLTRQGDGRLKWWVGDVNHDDSSINTGKMLSPVRAWNASQFQNVEFTMAVSGTQKLNLKWCKPGQFGQNEFRSAITVTGDGTERAYQFNLSNLPGWGGTISYLGLEADLRMNNPAAYILLRRARKFDLSGFGELVLISLAAGVALRRRKVLPVRMRKPAIKSKINQAV